MARNQNVTTMLSVTTRCVEFRIIIHPNRLSDFQKYALRKKTSKKKHEHEQILL